MKVQIVLTLDPETNQLQLSIPQGMPPGEVVLQLERAKMLAIQAGSQPRGPQVEIPPAALQKQLISNGVHHG